MHGIKKFSIACSRIEHNQMYIQVQFLMGQLGGWSVAHRECEKALDTKCHNFLLLIVWTMKEKQMNANWSPSLTNFKPGLSLFFLNAAVLCRCGLFFININWLFSWIGSICCFTQFLMMDIYHSVWAYFQRYLKIVCIECRFEME